MSFVLLLCSAMSVLCLLRTFNLFPVLNTSSGNSISKLLVPWTTTALHQQHSNMAVKVVQYLPSSSHNTAGPAPQN